MSVRKARSHVRAVTPPHERDAWDDDAWASHSDDDDFVKRVVSTPVERRASVRRKKHAAPTPPSSGGMWMPVPGDAPGDSGGDGYEFNSTSERETAHAAEAPARDAPPQGHAPLQMLSPDTHDAELAAWAEQSFHIADTPARSPRPACASVARLDAVVRDPMTALEAYAEDEGDDAPSDVPSDAPAPPTPEQGAHTAAQLDALYAPAFDPLATTGDGVIMSVASGSSGTSVASDATPRDATPPPPPPPAEPVRRLRSMRSRRVQQQLLQCLSADNINLGTLRALAWKGVPPTLRPVVWQLLLGYLPTASSTRCSTLARKRAEYAAGVERAFARGKASLDQVVWHQIFIDVPRTNPGIRLWQQGETQRVRRRVQLTLTAGARAHPVCVGDTTSRERVRPGDQRPRDALLRGVPVCLHHQGPRGVRPRAAAAARTPGARGRHVLVPVKAARRDPGPLHLRAAGHRAADSAHGRAGCADRRAAARAPHCAERRVCAICVPLDELPLDARDERKEHHTHVGHVSGACFSRVR